MKRTQKRLLITLCVVVGVVVILSVAVRVMLTRDVLMDLVVPRLERAVKAEIEVQDISVRFPFGFGVDIEGLSFEKTLPQGERIVFEGERIVARASLVSLLKRKPVIKSVDIENGRIAAAGGPQNIDAKVAGLRAGLSMQPVADGYRVVADITTSSVQLSIKEKPPVELGAVDFAGEMMLDAAFDSLHIEKGTVSWNELVTFGLEGGIGDLKGSRSVSLRFSSGAIDLPPLGAWALAIAPETDTGEERRTRAVDVLAGTFLAEATVSGSLAQPGELAVSGIATFEGVELEHPALHGVIGAGGKVQFSRTNLRSDGMEITFGSSKITAGFDAGIVDKTKIGDIELNLDAALRINDLLPPERREGLEADGSVGLKLDIQGTPARLAALIPAEDGNVAPADIGRAWKNANVKGSASLVDVGFASEGSPFRLDGLTGNARIDGGDVNDVDAAFRLNGSPYSCRATFTNIIPAAMELIARAVELGDKPTEDLEPLLRNMVNAPRFDATLEGRSLDLRPFEKQEGEEGGASGGGTAGTAAERSAAGANLFSFLALKNTTFEARIDSVVATKALFTGVDAKGTIRDGLLVADPVTLKYAGGRGRARFEADLRKPKRIENRLEISFEEVQADRALEAMHPLGRFLIGSFSFTSNASFTSGPGLDPLASLSGKGFALSSSGSVDVSRFISPLTETGLIDLSHLSKFDFRDWSGNFILREGRFITENWTISSNRGDWAIKGSFGLDGTLDYAARLVVPPAVQAQMKDLSKYRDLVDLFRDAEGNLVLDLDFGGTSRDPKVSIDMSRAGEKAAEKARNELLEKAKKLFKK